VRPGADSGGVDFTLSPMKLHRVRGVVLNSITGQPATSTTVALVPRNTSVLGALNARPSSDGTFDIEGAFPAPYFLVASAGTDAGGGAVRIMGGRTPVDVGNTDLDRVVVSLMPSVDIAGQVVTENLGNVTIDDSHPIVSLKSDLARLPG